MRASTMGVHQVASRFVVEWTRPILRHWLVFVATQYVCLTHQIRIVEQSPNGHQRRVEVDLSKLLVKHF